MGYPVITRLGINQFWYRHWFSKKNFQKSSQQDKLFLELLKLYINYGLSFNNLIFFNSYFFKNTKLNFLGNSAELNLKFFRRYFFSNEPLGIEHSYLLRYRTGEYFPIRLWLIKYSRWVMLFFTCFKPIKSKHFANSQKKKEIQTTTSGVNHNLSFFKVKRFILIHTLLSKKLDPDLKYNF